MQDEAILDESNVAFVHSLVESRDSLIRRSAEVAYEKITRTS